MATPMRCHYEVMELARTCTIEDIKKKYKQLALKYHPDRNHGEEELATTKFKELSTAYAVLNDSNERKWYDDHRDAILRGGDGTAEEDEEKSNLFKFFNATCYSGYQDDSPNGFYNVYSAAFEEIWKRESDISANGKSLKQAPIYGSSTTSIDRVLIFYSFWENFATVRLFSCVDMYNTIDAPNRATRRIMEKENLKLREVARKEFNSQVRSLASFIRKRDQRVIIYENELRVKRSEAEELQKALKVEQLQLKKDARERKLQQYQNDLEEQEVRDKERKKAFLLADNDDSDDDNSPSYYNDSAFNYPGLSSDDLNIEINGDSGLSDKLQASTFADKMDSIDGSGNSDKSINDATFNSSIFNCDLCCKVFKLETQLSQHLASKVHRKKVQDQLKNNSKKKKQHSTQQSKSKQTLDELIRVESDDDN